MKPDSAHTTPLSMISEPPFKIVTLEKLLSEVFPARGNILAPWLPCQGLCMIHAPRGIGKTHLALGIGYAVACGGPFLKWYAEIARNVLIIDGEMPASVLQERLANIVKSSENELKAKLEFITPDFQPMCMPDLCKADDQAELEDAVADKELIIVDNISTICRTGKENEAESWLPVQEWALHMRAAGKSVLFIHHSGKGGNQRGTSKREDILDTVITLRHGEDYRHEDGALFEVIFEKARGIYGEDVEPFIAQLSTDEHGVQCWLTESIEESIYKKVLALHDDAFSQKDIADELGKNKSTVSRYLKRARMEGLI